MCWSLLSYTPLLTKLKLLCLQVFERSLQRVERVDTGGIVRSIAGGTKSAQFKAQLSEDPNRRPVNGKHYCVDTFEAQDLETIINRETRRASGNTAVPMGTIYNVSNLSAMVGRVEDAEANSPDAFAEFLRNNCPAKALSCAEGAPMEFEAVDYILHRGGNQLTCEGSRFDVGAPAEPGMEVRLCKLTKNESFTTEDRHSVWDTFITHGMDCTPVQKVKLSKQDSDDFLVEAFQ